MPSKSLLRTTFHTGITIKGIDGMLETVSGVLLWLIKPSVLDRTLQTLLDHDLPRDPHDFIGMHLLHISQQLIHTNPVFASLYLLSHGLVKIVLAVALWLNGLWAYPVAIFVFGAFSVYQIYRYNHTHSPALLLLTIFDLAVIWLTWEEYRVQKSLREVKAGK